MITARGNRHEDTAVVACGTAAPTVTLGLVDAWFRWTVHPLLLYVGLRFWWLVARSLPSLLDFGLEFFNAVVFVLQFRSQLYDFGLEFLLGRAGPK